MRHFLFEFITGGGLSGKELPVTLAHEGDMMLKRLLGDLLLARHSNIFITRDARLPHLTDNVTEYAIDKNLHDSLSAIVEKNDCVWLIAPETENCLAAYTDFFTKQGCKCIGSTSDAIRTVSSKLHTFQVLKKANIETINTIIATEEPPAVQNGWIIKPDDGAGAEGCYYFCDKTALNAYLSNCNKNKHIIQEFFLGEHISISFLVNEASVLLLGCNRQYIEYEDGKVRLVAIGVNEVTHVYNALLSIAKRIVSVIPGLVGYVGVDLIMRDGNFFVVEINPRLTTAYVGLSESLGVHIVNLILDIFLYKKLPDINIAGAKSVRIDLR